MREKYLDNIKTLIILLLIPYHTFMIWNNFGAKFYIWVGNNNILSSLIVSLSPWLMPTLFLIAGISARYSLNKRNTKEFIKERSKKLMIPFFSILVLLVPFQTLFARKYFYNYSGGIIDNLIYFFSHFSDLNGYDGMFTLGHLWFLLYLFIISLIGLLIIKKTSLSITYKKINIFAIILIFIPIFISHYIGNVSGQSIGKYLLLYLLGYYLFTDEFIKGLLNNKTIILSLFLISQITLVILYFKYSYYGDLLVNFTGWLGVLSCLIIGKLFLNKKNKITIYFKKASFPIYLLHQTILVIIAYYTLIITNNLILQLFIIILGSLMVTLLVYEIIKKIPIINKTIGIQ